VSREWRLRIEDILESISRIEQYTFRHSADSFDDDQLVIDAVVRNLEIIGEAATHIPAEVRQQHPEIPWNEMKGMRNLLAHEYFGVSTAIVWATTQDNLPPLKPLLEKILIEK
jgi:uncharacterized protein with HEPN domain